MSGTSEAQRRFQDLLDKIPGYRGYRDKEDRRDADRRVREHVARAFGAQADRVERVARQLADQRRIREVGPVDELARSIRHVVDRIMTASYGYGGLFSDRNIDEIALDQLRRFDESLLQGVNELDAPIAALEHAAPAGGDLTVPAREGIAATRVILERLNARSDVIETGKPLPDASVLKLLQPEKGRRQPPAAFSLDLGDALSILGDNFVVDARIDLNAGEHALRIVRLDAASGRWLAVFADPDTTPFVGQSRQEPLQPGQAVTIDGITFSLTWSAAGTGELRTMDGSSGRRAVNVSVYSAQQDPQASAVVVDWGKEQQIFWGHQVHAGDIEVFGTVKQS